MNLAIDAKLPNTPRDQLGVLGSEIKNKDTVLMDINRA